MHLLSALLRGLEPRVLRLRVPRVGELLERDGRIAVDAELRLHVQPDPRRLDVDLHESRCRGEQRRAAEGERSVELRAHEQDDVRLHQRDLADLPPVRLAPGCGRPGVRAAGVRGVFGGVRSASITSNPTADRSAGSPL